MIIKVKIVNAFSESHSGGNPAGVLLDSPDLNENQMKYVSQELAVSETAFVFPSKKADYMLRFFSPKIEVELCGHATIATFFTMAVEGKFSKCKKNIFVTQETKTGILPINISFNEFNKVERVMMTQRKPEFKDIHLDTSSIANSLNISADEIDTSLPRQIVSTGLFTLPLCINYFDVLEKINPNFEKIEMICRELGVGSFHLFTFDKIDFNSLYHARNFAPVYGINEDPVTGTANGAVCSYLLKHGIIKKGIFICEQGDIIGRSGRVFVDLNNDKVMVGGKAVIVEEKLLNV